MAVFVVRSGKLFTQRAAHALDPGKAKPPARKPIVKARGAQPLSRASGETSAFARTGLNLPLTIRIAHVYTGRYPARSFFRGARSDMLLTSTIKSYSVFTEAPRAIQYYERTVAARCQPRSVSSARRTLKRRTRLHPTRLHVCGGLAQVSLFQPAETSDRSALSAQERSVFIVSGSRSAIFANSSWNKLMCRSQKSVPSRGASGVPCTIA